MIRILIHECLERLYDIVFYDVFVTQIIGTKIKRFSLMVQRSLLTLHCIMSYSGLIHHIAQVEYKDLYDTSTL